MSEVIFLIVICLVFACYLYWGIRTLPREGWQILASVPVHKRDDGEWRGVNLTWYGLFTANAYVVAVAVLFVLMGAVGVPAAGTAALAFAMLSLCVPASRLVARVVEKKAHTFTVGGAVFVGVIMAPWVVLLVNRWLAPQLRFHIPLAPALAAFSIAYAFGEGLGRLACLSFGCCYGKPLREARPWLRKALAGSSVAFYGNTRKIAYAGGLEGEKVLPVQALTAIIYVCCGIGCSFLFLRGAFASAFVVSMLLTQAWRVISETLRADYRGAGKISAYQIMGMAAIIYGGAAIYLAPAVPRFRPEISGLLTSLYRPDLILFIQALWLAIFLYTGRSTVTGSTLSFHVHHERI